MRPESRRVLANPTPERHEQSAGEAIRVRAEVHPGNPDVIEVVALAIPTATAERGGPLGCCRD